MKSNLDPELEDFTRWCRRVLRNPAYRARLELKAAEGQLTDKEEERFWLWAYGKPSQAISLQLTEDFSKLSHDELLTRAEALAETLRTLTSEEDVNGEPEDRLVN